jgi:hypothetical protein
MNKLATWPTRETGLGLTLELAVYSPSDYMHCLKHDAFDVPCLEAGKHAVESSRRHCHRRTKRLRLPVGRLYDDRTDDPRHGWTRGIWHWDDETPGASLRLISMMCFPWQTIRTRQIPEVKVVTELLIRRACFRRLSLSHLTVILRSLSQVKSFRHEFWAYGGWCGRSCDSEYSTTHPLYPDISLRSQDSNVDDHR